jgi:hypothetical protein
MLKLGIRRTEWSASRLDHFTLSETWHSPSIVVRIFFCECYPIIDHHLNFFFLVLNFVKFSCVTLCKTECVTEFAF